jgi:hypothetical protein
METDKQILIHCIEAMQYRFAKATNVSKEDFGDFKLSNDPESRGKS